MLLGERLAIAMDVRNSAAGFSLSTIAQRMKKDPRQLRAWRADQSEPGFGAVEEINQVYEAEGLPGLIADMGQLRAWQCEELPIVRRQMPEQARALLDCAGGLKLVRGDVAPFLEDRGLLAHTHIFRRNRANNSLSLSYRGGKMKTARQIDTSAIGRDLRDLDPRLYSHMVYRHVLKHIEKGAIALERITAPDVRYLRLGIPLEDTYVAMSFDIEASRSFLLR